MGRKRVSRSKDSNRSTIIAVVVIALVVGIYFGAVFIPAFKESSDRKVVANSGTEDLTQRITEAKKLVEATPGSARLWAKLGDLYFDSGQHYKAIDAYKSSLAIKPGNSQVLTDLGVMYRRTDRSQQALDCFDQAISASPQNETPYLNKGIVLYYDLQDKAGAIKVWRRLLEQNPNAKALNGKTVKQMIQDLS